MGMNRKFVTFLMVTLIGLIFLTVGALASADKVDKGPDEIMIENSGYEKDKKGPVAFSHKKHHDEYKTVCADCHHKYEGDKNIWKEGDPVQKCSACHDPKAKKDKADKLQNSYHKNCKDCHKKLIAEGKEAEKLPYKKCNDCHQKKS